MQILYFFEQMRNPVLDAFFSTITMLGEETAFMAISIIFFWCVNKFKGYFLLITGFFGTVINQFLKMLFRVPRPWVKDPEFTIVESAREGASGYSFPSGHTQTSVTLFGGVARTNKNKPLVITAIVLCVLVPVSRWYLGVHTFEDVITSVAISLALVFLGYPLFKKAEESPKVMCSILIALAVLVTAFTLFVYLYPFPSEVFVGESIKNYESAKKNAFTLIGCMFGLFIVYFVDSKYLKFETEAVWWAQIIKVVLGLGVILLVKEGLRAPIDAICGGHLIARSIRYFLIVITAGIVWPLTFKWFKKLGKKQSK